MLKRFGGVMICIFFLVGCGQANPTGKLEKVGVLIPETIDDQVWGNVGYKGMLKIQSKFNVETHFKEGMDSYLAVEQAVKEYDQKGINLIFGHGSEYASYFNELADEYPHIHFVSFNGDARLTNTTSLNFEAYSMGFFGGMVAAHMSNSDQVAVIAAFEWQPEVEGFFEGATYERDNVSVQIEYVGHWGDKSKALQVLEDLINDGVDVVYPAGDGYNVPVIEKLKEEGLYAIGYVSDQSDLGESTVLVSTVQHVDILYEKIAEQFNNGVLKNGNLTFDFEDGVISMGKFSPLVDQDFQQKIATFVDQYKKTGKLPNE